MPLTGEVRTKLDWLDEIMDLGPLVDTPDYLRSLLFQARHELLRWGKVQSNTKDKIKEELKRRKEPIDDLLSRIDLL